MEVYKIGLQPKGPRPREGGRQGDEGDHTEKEKREISANVARLLTRQFTGFI